MMALGAAGLSDLCMERDPMGGGTALFSLPVQVAGEAEPRSLYRYVLERRLQPRPEARKPGTRLVSCGLNPSTANAFKLDRTTEREVGYALAWGCEVYTKINARAWRDTHPVDMFRAERAGIDVNGPSNDQAIAMTLMQLKRDGGVLLAAWGVGVSKPRALELIKLAHSVGLQWQCLGMNSDGSPAHTLIRRSVQRDDNAAPILLPWPGALHTS